MKLIPITFHKLMQARTYTTIILEANKKFFPIYVDSTIGKIMQTELTESPKERPMTHDLIHSVFKALDVNIKQVVIYDVENSIYYAKLLLEHKKEDYTHLIEIDVRPSDCLTLAIMNGSSLYCTKAVLEKTIFIDDDI